MINILLSGALGYMGQVIYRTTLESGDMRVVEGVDRQEQAQPFPVHTGFQQVEAQPDIVMDFSHPSALEPLLSYCVGQGVPAVICTTGHTEAQQKNINNAAQSIPVFYTYNTSLGIALMRTLVQQAAKVLDDGYDIEILEKHHRRKLDAPSGTAIMLYESINQGLDKPKKAVFDRHKNREERDSSDIGILSLRGGTMTGEHSVMFCGEDEVIEINHITSSRNVFAMGALRAAKFLPGQLPGMYDMDDVIKWLNN